MLEGLLLYFFVTFPYDFVTKLDFLHICNIIKIYDTKIKKI